jgi:hypothetical protein
VTYSLRLRSKGEKKMRFYLQYNQSKMDWRYGSIGRVSALQNLNPRTTKKKKKRKRKKRNPLLVILWKLFQYFFEPIIHQCANNLQVQH